MKPAGNIDEIVDATLPEQNFAPPDPKQGSRIEFGRTVRVRGWLITADREPFESVSVVIGGRIYPCTYGGLRADIARFFSRPRLAYTGFSARVPTSDFLPGEYPCALRGTSPNGEII